MSEEKLVRKTRADKGVPRRSTLSSLYDQFADLDLSTQLTVLEVCGEINRQARRGRIDARPAAVQTEITEEQ